MIIKKFQGKTEEEAMELAKKELGNSVVLMNVKQVKKKGLFSILKPQLIEVTVALEEEPVDQTASLRSAVAAVSEIAQSQVRREESQKTESVSTESVKEAVKVEKAMPEKPTEKKEEKVIEEKLNTMIQNMLEKQIGQKEDVQENEKNENVEFFKLLYNVMMENELDE